MKYIYITKGKRVKVDDADFEFLSQYKWYFSDKGYAKRGYPDPISGKTKQQTMHKLLIHAPKGMEIDHVNRDKLDNQRANLRLCTKSQNMSNIEKRKKSIFKGVSFNKFVGKFSATITFNYKTYHLGQFYSAVEAALAYNEAAIKIHGEFAVLNVIDEYDLSKSQLLQKPISKASKSGFRGVYFRPKTKKYRACIKVNGKYIELGSFDTAIEAAIVFNDAAKKYRPTERILNIIPE